MKNATWAGRVGASQTVKYKHCSVSTSVDHALVRFSASQSFHDFFRAIFFQCVHSISHIYFFVVHSKIHTICSVSYLDRDCFMDFVVRQQNLMRGLYRCHIGIKRGKIPLFSKPFVHFNRNVLFTHGKKRENACDNNANKEIPFEGVACVWQNRVIKLVFDA